VEQEQVDNVNECSTSSMVLGGADRGVGHDPLQQGERGGAR
jgi:hypothetical protein